MSKAHHAIKAVVRRTGLTAHVIRIWEKRYGAVAPERTGTNRRLYSEAQIERLYLLRVATHAGHSIRTIAKLDTLKLRKLAVAAGGLRARAEPPAGGPPPETSLRELCIAAVQALNARALEDALTHAEIEFGRQGALQRVIAPFAQALGDLWRTGAISAAQEHFAAAILRTFLGNAAHGFVPNAGGPVIVVATPAGQVHELGALLAAATAANLGWHVIYLGPSLPATEIAGVARKHHARVLALSLVYPEDDPRLDAELKQLLALLPVETVLVVGGRAMPSYRRSFDHFGVELLTDLPALCTVLDDLRKRESPPPKTAAARRK